MIIKMIQNLENKMKEQIKRWAIVQGDARDVKEGPGGIKE